MRFGKLQSFHQEQNAVILLFEEREARIEIITDQIIRVFSDMGNKVEHSKAIEENKTKNTSFTIKQEHDAITIRTKEVQVQVFEDFRVDFQDLSGKSICRDYQKKRKEQKEITTEMQDFMSKEGHEVTEERQELPISIVKELEGDECFYGLGDKTGFLNKREYAYQMWNTDNPAPQVDCFQALYKSIPFFITLKKEAVYGIFFDNTYRTYFNMGKESQEYYWFGCEQGNLDYYYIAGKNMTEIVGGYTYLTGTVPLPQRFTLGYQQSRWGYVSEEDVCHIADSMRQYDIPCDVIHLDIDYMQEYKVFTWNKNRYHNPQNTLKRLAAKGFKIVTIIDPGVKLEEGYEVYDTGIEHKYFAMTQKDEVYVNAVWPGDAVYPDFGQKRVRDWWGENHKMLLDMGVRGIWNDMNEPASFKGELPGDIVFYDEKEKSNHDAMHNVYGHNMAKATYEGLKKLDGRRPFVITRACYSGSQKYATGWTGDNHSIWAHLQMAIPQLCNLGLSGMSFVGTDIGGFSSDTTPELLLRWVEVGCFSPLFRNHAALGTRAQEPWQFGKGVLDIYRTYVKLRYTWISYYYDLFFQGEKTGLPVMRPLVLHYEKDEEAKNCNDQFLIGENILVSPVVEQGKTHKMVYLPEGIWYDYWTKEKVEGPIHFIKEAPLSCCPIYVKAGSILPNDPPQAYVTEEDRDTLILDIYPGEGSYTHVQDNGMDFAYREGGYNEYVFTMDAAQVLHMKLTHHGYHNVYQEISIKYQGREQKVGFASNKEVTLS